MEQEVMFDMLFSFNFLNISKIKYNKTFNLYLKQQIL